MAGDVVLFAGPSMFGLDPALVAAAVTDLRPPVRRGDVDRLLAEADGPGVLVVCDGVFHVGPAVSHAELCRALDAGWQVWGVSSLGAIRAHEMRAEGMRGFGRVHAMFERFDDFTDDEMCLLHYPEAPYFPVSLALVDVRHALESHRRHFGMSEACADALIDGLRALWFGDRTPERVRELVRAHRDAHAGVDPRAEEHLLDWVSANRVKAMDLAALLAQRPWRAPAASARTP